MRFMCAREKNRLKSNFIHFCPGCLVCRYSESDTVPGKRILEDGRNRKAGENPFEFCRFYRRIDRPGKIMFPGGLYCFRKIFKRLRIRLFRSSMTNSISSSSSPIPIRYWYCSLKSSKTLDDSCFFSTSLIFLTISSSPRLRFVARM